MALTEAEVELVLEGVAEQLNSPATAARYLSILRRALTQVPTHDAVGLRMFAAELTMSVQAQFYPAWQRAVAVSKAMRASGAITAELPDIMEKTKKRVLGGGGSAPPQRSWQGQAHYLGVALGVLVEMYGGSPKGEWIGERPVYWHELLTTTWGKLKAKIAEVKLRQRAAMCTTAAVQLVEWGWPERNGKFPNDDDIALRKYPGDANSRFTVDEVQELLRKENTPVALLVDEGYYLNRNLYKLRLRGEAEASPRVTSTAWAEAAAMTADFESTFIRVLRIDEGPASNAPEAEHEAWKKQLLYSPAKMIAEALGGFTEAAEKPEDRSKYLPPARAYFYLPTGSRWYSGKYKCLPNHPAFDAVKAEHGLESDPNAPPITDEILRYCDEHYARYVEGQKAYAKDRTRMDHPEHEQYVAEQEALRAAAYAKAQAEQAAARAAAKAPAPATPDGYVLIDGSVTDDGHGDGDEHGDEHVGERGYEHTEFAGVVNKDDAVLEDGRLRPGVHIDENGEERYIVDVDEDGNLIRPKMPLIDINFNPAPPDAEIDAEIYEQMKADGRLVPVDD